MAKLLASSQITIVDLNDAVSLRSYIGCTHARVQFLSNNGTYTPNFAQASDNVILTAEMNKLGDNTNLIQNPGTSVSRVDWYVKIAPSQTYKKITPSMAEYELIGTSPYFSGLKIKSNIMNASHPGATFKVEIDFKENWMEDVHTQISEIDFNLTVQGNDGKDAYTAILTNPSHTIICNPDGSADSGEIGVNGRAVSDTIAYKGTKVLTAVTGNPTTGQYSITLEPTECTAVKKDADTFYIDTISTATASIASDGALESANLASVRSLTNGGKVKVKFNLEGVTTLVQEMTFSKVYNGSDGQDGQDGRDGESAKYITLNIKEGTSTFKYNKNSSTPTISKTILQAISFNIATPSYKWYYFANGTWNLISGQTRAELIVNATDSYFTSNSSVAFRCVVNDLYKDEITISKLVDGSDSLIVNLSNESHVIACYNGGGFKPGEADRATTEIIAYKGVTPLTLTTSTPSIGQYKIEVVTNSDVTHTLSGNTIKITNMTADSAVLVINVNCEGTVIKKTMSLSKAKDGREGVDGYVAALTNEFHSLPAKSDGTVTSFNGCNSSIELYKGSDLVTTGVTYSATANSGVTGSLSGNTYTVTGLSVDTSSVNLTATYNGKSYSKTFTITKNKQGSDGSDSTSYWLIPSSTAINKDKNGVLSPSTITYMAKSQTGDQSLVSFSGRFKIYKSLDKGASFGNPVYTSTANESSKQYSVPSDATAIKCELYLPNGTTLVDTQTIIVTSDGQDGQNGQDAAYVRVSGEGIFKYGPNFIGAPTPSTIVLTRSLYNTSGGKWQYNDGTSWVDFSPAQTGGTLEVTPTMAHFATSSNKTMRVRYYISNSIYDETSIVKVADGINGTNAFTVVLDNESHTVAADKNGALLSGEAAKAKTGVTVYKGSEVVTSFTLSKVADDGIVTSIDNTAKTITLTSMPNANMSGKCTVSIIVEGQTIQKIFSITKSKQAADGTSPKLLNLTATAQTFKYAAGTNLSTGTPSPATITLKADLQNLSNTTKTWKYKPNTASDWIVLQSATTNNSVSYNVNPKNTSLFPSGAVSCQFMCTADGMTDYVTIAKVQDGTAGVDAYTVVLSNPSHTVPASSNGTVTSSNLATCTTDIIVYKGSSTIKPTVNNLVSVPSGVFTIVAATDTTNAKITMSSFPTNVDTATATVNVVAGGQTLKQTFTVTKAKQGIAGNSVKSVVVSGAQIFKYAKNSTTPSPSTITISAVENNFTGSSRKWYANGTVISGQTGTNLVINPTSSTTGQYFMNSDSVTFKYEADGKTDEITITKMYDGSDTYSVVLTNEVHAISCDKNGNPLSGELNKALTKVRVFRGSTELTASNTAATNKFKITTGTVVGGTAEYVAENSVNVGVKVKTITADSGSIPISINIDNGKATIEKVFSFNKLKVGATGASAKVIQITGASSIVYKSNGTYDPSSGIALTIQKKNTTDNVVWKVNGSQVGTGDTYTVPTSVFANIKNYIIRAELASDSTVYDTHSISKVSDGVDSVTSYVWCPNGSTIKNENADSLIVEGVIFSGATNVSTTSGATYFWEKKVGNNWVAIKGTSSAPIAGNAGGNSVTVTREDIPYMLIVKCTMKYGSVTQIDTIVLEDISDPIHSNIFSTAGETFKNGQGETYLVAHVIRNGEDLDPIVLLDTKPSSAGSQGEIVYVKADKKYYKFNNNAWTAINTPSAGDNSTYTYTWSKADANGNITSGWSRSGKIIHVTANEIYQKTIFMVDVEGQ